MFSSKFYQMGSVLRRFGLNKAKAATVWNNAIDQQAENFTVVRISKEQLAKAKPVHDAVKSRPINPAPAARMREITFEHDPVETTLLLEKTNPMNWFTKD